MKKKQIELRPAIYEDAKMVFNWRNNPYIVARSSSQNTVQWNEHLQWFEETIKSNHRKMSIIHIDKKPIGQIRFDLLNSDVCVISIYLLQEFTNKGYGIQAIRYGCSNIFETWNIKKVIACLRLDNLSARSAFTKAGFLEHDSKKYCPSGHYELYLLRPSTSTSRRPILDREK